MQGRTMVQIIAEKRRAAQEAEAALAAAEQQEEVMPNGDLEREAVVEPTDPMESMSAAQLLEAAAAKFLVGAAVKLASNPDVVSEIVAVRRQVLNLADRAREFNV